MPMPSASSLTYASSGMVPTDGTTMDFTGLLTGGVPAEITPSNPPLAAWERPAILGTADGLSSFKLVDTASLQQAGSLRDADGVLVSSTQGFIELGSGHNLSFDSATSAGLITPAFASQALDGLDNLPGGGLTSFTGSDMRLVLEVENPPQTGDAAGRYSYQILECTTLSISIHRVKSRASAGGFIGAKGYARGNRTIAGSMIFTQFSAEVLFRFLQTVLFQDQAKDMHYMKVDQLPPFNISILFSNELGYSSYRRLLGVDFVTDGTVYSINDMFTEQSVSYVAADLTPLLPLTLSSLYRPAGVVPAFSYERSVPDLFSNFAQNRLPTTIVRQN